jgi:Zn-dependent protease with chaperone function
LIPQLRRHYIERKIHFVPPALSMPLGKQLIEIEDFVKSHAPDLKVQVNLNRPGRLWIYLNGYRTATLAIFYGFVMLWKTDREAAEAVLLHEIAHYRRGDALFIGPASFLEIALKLDLIFYVVFIALPMLAIANEWLPALFFAALILILVFITHFYCQCNKCMDLAFVEYLARRTKRRPFCGA